MKRYLMLVMLLFYGKLMFSQGEENYWTFGRKYSLNFSTQPPTLNDNHQIGFPLSFYNSISISNSNGQLLFSVRFNEDIREPNINHIYDRDDNPVPGTNLMGNVQLSGAPVVIQHGGNDNQYYIFYVRNKALHYSLFDISLNNGFGNIVTNQKDIRLTGFGTVIGQRMTAVKGCTGVWLVIRSHHANEYYSFLIDRQGLHPEPVVSETGLFTVVNYQTELNGDLKASPNGRLLATGLPARGIYNFIGGLELYDFSPCDGKVSNARILDTGAWINGVCFSPDNSKLYMTQNDYPTSNGYRHYGGQVYQYDLDQPNLNAIINSKTLVITNPITYENDPYQCGGCHCPMNFGLGDMKVGPDGKIYLLNQSDLTCRTTVNPQDNNPGMAFHIIHEPNSAGLACQPEINAIFNSINGMQGNLSSPSVSLPKEFINQPPVPDTLIGTTHQVYACFGDSLLLRAEDGECLLWDNGSTQRERWAQAPGTYHVRYFKECSIVIDTYKVHHIPLPEIPLLTHGCPGEIIVSIRNKTGDTTTYNYRLFNEQVTFISTSNNGYNFAGLHGGDWLLQITTEAGCDTTIRIQLDEYPVPVITTAPKDTMIYYGDTIRISASGAYLYTWNYVSSLDTPTIAAPLVSPKKPTTYRVIGLNEYGCRSEGFVHVDIDYTMPPFIPNAFSPNGDGINDVFRIPNINYQRISAFRVYDRFGNLVFTTMNPDVGWDGTYKGRKCDLGTYFYFIELVFPDGQVRQFKGDLTLIR